MVNAEAISLWISSKEKWGKDGLGSMVGILPNLLPMVSTGRSSIKTNMVVAMIAITDPGIFRVTLGQIAMITRVAPPMAMVL
jgi:hypothetical protein